MYVVTGGAGFIGSHVVGDLLDAGERVVVLDNFSTGTRANLQGLDPQRLAIIEADISDGLWSAMAEVDPAWGRPRAIIHLAAQVSVVASVANPLDDARKNHTSTLHVLEYARCSGAPRVVFASSAATYGDVDTVPLEEPMARWPMSPYGIHKFSSELSLRYYAEVHGLSTASLRFFNVYGPRQDPHNPYSGVISIFMRKPWTATRWPCSATGSKPATSSTWGTCRGRFDVRPSRTSVAMSSMSEVGSRPRSTRWRSRSSPCAEAPRRSSTYHRARARSFVRPPTSPWRGAPWATSPQSRSVMAFKRRWDGFAGTD